MKRPKKLNDKTQAESVIPIKKKKMKVKKPKMLKDAIISNEIQAESVIPIKKKKKKMKDAMNDKTETESIIPINKKKKKEMKDTICDETQTESVIPIKKKKMKDAINDKTQTESVIPINKKKKKKMKDAINDKTQTESIIPINNNNKKKKMKDVTNDKSQTESIIPINKKKKKKMKDTINDKSQTESFIPIKKKKMKDVINDKTQTESFIPINKKKKKKMKSVNGQINGEGNIDARTTMAGVDGSRDDEANTFSAEEKSQGKVWNETKHINGGNGVSAENWNETEHIDGVSAEDKEQEKVWDDIERFEQENEFGEEDKEQDKVWNDIEHFEQKNEVRTEENAEPERQELTRAEMLEMEKRTVFVGNVNITTKRKQLLKFFSKYGKVETLRLRSAAVAKHGMTKKESVIMKKFHKQRSSLNAYIRFTQKEMVEEALKANGIEFMEKHLRVDRSIQSETGGKENKKHAVFIGNLPFGAEEEDLWRYFADCGEIDNVRVIRDSESGSCKGFCFINFKSSGGVEIALLKHGEEFMGRELRVMRCHKKPKQKYGPTKRGVYGDRNKMQSGFKTRKPTTTNNYNNREFPQNKIEGKHSGTTSSKKMQSGFKKRKLTTTNNNNNKEFPQNKVESKYSTTTSKKNTKGGYTGMKMTENKKFKKVKKAKGKLRKEERKKKSIAHHLTGVKKNKKKTV